MYLVVNRSTGESVAGPMTSDQLREWILSKAKEEKSLAKFVYRKQS